MAQQAFSENGVFNFNEQWVTTLRYEAKLEQGKLIDATVKFMNGRKQIATVKLMNRQEAIELLGEKNVANIEAELGKDKNSPADKSKGKLQGEHLAYKKSYTTTLSPENQIEQDVEPERTPDPQLERFIKMRREQIRKLNEKLRLQAMAKKGFDNDPGIHAKDAVTEETPGQQPDGDLSQVLPDIIHERFVQVKEKFFFPDQTLAFHDRGTKLTTPSENKIVVNSLVLIAQARGWDQIKITGTQEFRQAVWLEASLQGIQVRGYRPTEVEKAQLEKLLENETSFNTIEKAAQFSKEETSQAIPTHQTDVPSHSAKTKENQKGIVTGKLLEHGSAPYEHDLNNEDSYFVKVETAQGTRTIWGIDFERAIAESEVTIGEKVAIEYQGKKPVTVTVKERNEKGDVIGEKQVTTHRNTWLIEKADAFRKEERHDVVKKHPDLASAYGTLAVARKFAEERWPHDKAEQERFITMMKESLASKIQQGTKIPAPKIRQAKEHHHPEKKQPEKSKVRERER